jgi:hypothetical protein
MADPAREGVPFMPPSNVPGGFSGRLPGVPPAEVIGKLPHSCGRPDDQKSGRRSVATVVHCCKEAVAVSPCITLVTEAPLGHAVRAIWGRECYLRRLHGAYSRFLPPAASLRVATIRPLHTPQTLPSMHFGTA